VYVDSGSLRCLHMRGKKCDVQKHNINAVYQMTEIINLCLCINGHEMWQTFIFVNFFSVALFLLVSELYQLKLFLRGSQKQIK